MSDVIGEGPILSGPVIDAQVSSGNAALIAYLPVGFPSVRQSIRAGQVLIENGVDIVELGFPYSDPVMDGPVIQQATTQALANGTHLEDLFEAVAALSASAPILSMTYWNPVNWYGIDAFAKAFAEARGAGLITPDLPSEEGADWIEASDHYGLERVFLAAPSSSAERLALIAKSSKGWVYAASTMGITGGREQLDAQTEALVARVRNAGAARVCVGIGVSNAKQARQLAAYADGVIVGSALIKPMLTEPFERALVQMGNLAAALKAGTTDARVR